MSPDDVIEILAFLSGASIPVWVDGGWGVDALLGEQTREHRDLDLAVRSQDEARFRAAVSQNGFLEVSAEPHNPVLRDARGRVIDAHFFDPSRVSDGPAGWLVYGDIAYDVGAFEGEGSILGVRVACTTVLSQVRSHRGYELDDEDIRDMKALRARFGAELPDEVWNKSIPES